MSRAARWLKQHAAGEKLLTRVLRKYFIAQGERVIEKVRDVGALPNADTWAMDLAAEHAALQAALAPPLIGMMGTAAEQVLKQAKRPKSTKAFDAAPLENFELPEWVQTAIGQAFTALEEQDYWEEIQRSTLHSVSDAVRAGIEAGDSMDNLAKSLRELFGDFSKTRAMAIARTETTLAYNFGHQTSYSYLAAEGLMSEKEWLAVVDDDTRAAHAEADGQKVGVADTFTVGGESCQFPGDPGLSAANRVHCRCTTAGVFE